MDATIVSATWIALILLAYQKNEPFFFCRASSRLQEILFRLMIVVVSPLNITTPNAQFVASLLPPNITLF